MKFSANMNDDIISQHIRLEDFDDTWELFTDVLDKRCEESKEDRIDYHHILLRVTLKEGVVEGESNVLDRTFIVQYTYCAHLGQNNPAGYNKVMVFPLTDVWEIPLLPIQTLLSLDADGDIESIRLLQSDYSYQMFFQDYYRDDNFDRDIPQQIKELPF